MKKKQVTTKEITNTANELSHIIPNMPEIIVIVLKKISVKKNPAEKIIEKLFNLSIKSKTP